MILFFSNFSYLYLVLLILFNSLEMFSRKSYATDVSITTLFLARENYICSLNRLLVLNIVGRRNARLDKGEYRKDGS